MILLRSQLMKWGTVIPRYLLSTSRRTKQAIQSQVPNPFATKSYGEINRIMSLSLSRKNQIIFCSLVLRSALDRMSSSINLREELSSAEEANKQALMNKVIQKMFAKLQELSPQDILLVIKMILYSYESRYFRLSNKNKDIFQNEFQSHIASQVEADKTGAHKDVFKKILYTMLRSKKRINMLKQIIDYLAIHDLKNNQEILQFFDQVSPLNRTGYYNNAIEPVLAKFLNLNATNLENASQWVQPAVLEVISMYTDKLAIEKNTYFKQFLTGLEHEFKLGKISINNQVLFLKELLFWAQSSSPYFHKIAEVKRGIELIYAIMKDLIRRIGQSEEEQSSKSLVQILVLEDKYRYFIKFAHPIIGKSQKFLLEQFNSFVATIFQKRFIPRLQQIGPDEIVEIINCRFELPSELNKLLVEKMIQFLHLHENEEHLITRLRIYECFTKLILEEQVQIDTSTLQPLVKKIESKSYKLKEYEIIRIHNVFRLLKLESPIIDNLFKQLTLKKESVIIENLSRTILKDFSISQIEMYSQSLISKSMASSKYINGTISDSQVQSNIRHILWSSFKKVKSEENINPLFLFWVDKHYRYFTSITRTYRNCYLILSNAVKEFNLGANGIENSINYEILFQVLQSWSRQNPRPKAEEYFQLISENLRTFAESENISTIFEREFRHVFFIKVMWVFFILNETTVMKESYVKRLRQITQVMLLVKSLKLSLYREKSSIKMLMLLSYLRSLNLQQNLKLKAYNLAIEPFFWQNYHSSIQMATEPLSTMSADKMEKCIQGKYGKTYLAEFLINQKFDFDREKEINDLIKTNPVLSKIQSGELTVETQLDQNQLMDSILFPSLLGYLFQRHPECCQPYLQRLTTLKIPILYQNLINLANKIDRFRRFLSFKSLRLLKQRVKSMVSGIDPVENPSILPLYVQFNICTPESASSLAAYIETQIRNCDIYITELLYINGYENPQLAQHLISFSFKNRVFDFFDKFKGERVLITNAFLGLSLNQNQSSTLRECLKILETNSALEHVLISCFPDSKQAVLECYMLIRIAISRFGSASPTQQQFVTKIVNEVRKQIPQIQEALLSSLKRSTCASIPIKVQQSLTFHPKATLPLLQGKLLVVDKDQPGYAKLVSQYFRTFYDVKDVRVVNADQLDLVLGFADTQIYGSDHQAQQI